MQQRILKKSTNRTENPESNKPLLSSSLPFRKVANDWQLKALAIEGFDQNHDPENHHGQADQWKKAEGEQAEEREKAPENKNGNVDRDPRTYEEDALPGMKADIGVFVIGLD
jgi:hypothetical protein